MNVDLFNGLIEELDENDTSIFSPGFSLDPLEIQLDSRLKKLSSGSHNRTIRVWDADTHEHVAILREHRNNVAKPHHLQEQAALLW